MSDYHTMLNRLPRRATLEHAMTTRAELKAMGVRVRGTISVERAGTDRPQWEVWAVRGWSTALLLDGFPTRRAAEQYARQLRRAMRGG